VSEELVDESVWRSLCAVSGLRKGEEGCAETAPVRAVTLERVYPIQPHTSP